jgi:death-on-curing protein
MIAFLRMNGHELNMTEDEAYNMVIQVAQGEMSKEELTSLLEQHLQVK